MGVIRRQSGYVTVIYVIGIVIGYVNLLVLYPLALTLSQIGLYRIFLNLALLLGSISTFGSGISIIKFYSRVGEEAIYKSQLFNLFIYSILGVFLITSSLIYAFKFEILSFYNLEVGQLDFVYWLIPIVLIIATSRTVESFGVVQLKGVFSEMILEVFLRVCILIVLLLIYFGVAQFEILIPATVIIYLISTVWISIYVKAPFRKLLTGVSQIPRLLRGKILKFASLMVFLSIGNMVVQNIDILMLGSMVGLEKTGIYAIALFIGNVIILPRKSIVRISSPILMRAWRDEDFKEVKILYLKSALNGFILSSIALGLVWINLDDLFRIIPNGENLVEGSLVVLLIGLMQVVDASFGINSEIIMASDNYKFNLFALLLLAVIAVGLNALFIPYYGISGAAFASLISIFIFNFSKWFYIKSRFKMQPFQLEFLYILLFGAGTIYCFSLFSISSIPMLNIAFKSFFYVLMVSFTLYYSNVSKDLRELIDIAKKRAMKSISNF